MRERRKRKRSIIIKGLKEGEGSLREKVAGAFEGSESRD